VINLPIPPPLPLPLINGSVFPVQELELNHALPMLTSQLHVLMLITYLLDKTVLPLPSLLPLLDLKVSGMMALQLPNNSLLATHSAKHALELVTPNALIALFSFYPLLSLHPVKLLPTIRPI